MSTDRDTEPPPDLPHVPYAAFQDPPPEPHRDTEPSDAPPEPDDMAEERPSIDDLSRAMARLESDLENQAAEIRRAIDKNAEDTKASVTKFLSTVIDRFAEGNKRMDAQAKAIRWLATEDRDRRQREGLPPLSCPVDDL